MKTSAKLCRCSRVLAAAVALGGATDAGAAGFDAARFGGEHGTVNTSNATALYYNPAGIANSSGTRLYVEGLVALREFSWQRTSALTAAPTPPGAEGADQGHAQLFDVFGAPTIGLTTRIGDLALGGAVFAPFGGSATFNRNERFAGSSEFPLAVDGVQRWHAIDGSLTFIYFTAGAAYRWGRLSLGLTGNLIHASLMDKRALNPTGAGDPDPSREGRSRLDASGLQASMGAGFTVEAIKNRLWLAGSYQAQPGLGPTNLDGTLETAYQGTVSSYPVTFTQALPDVVRAGLRFRASDTIELRAAADLTRWNVMVSQCLSLEGRPCAVLSSGLDATAEGTTVQNSRRRWRDTYGARLGFGYWFRPEAELFLGAGYEQGAVPDETLEPNLADANNVMGALGGRFQFAGTWFVEASYSYFHYATRDNRGKSQLTNAEAPTKAPDGGGIYRQWLGLGQLSLEKQF